MRLGFISSDLCVYMFMSTVLGIHYYNLELFISSFSEDRLRLTVSPQLSSRMQKHIAFKHFSYLMFFLWESKLFYILINILNKLLLNTMMFNLQSFF